MAKIPRGERIIIGITGKTNVGKSSLINAITGQEIAIVSDKSGTTTDPVAKHYELLPLGSVTIYDTAGIDDTSELGKKRIKSTKKVLWRCDLVLLTVDERGLNNFDKYFINELNKYNIPFIIVFNKSDIKNPSKIDIEFCRQNKFLHIAVSGKTQENIDNLKELIISQAPQYLKREKVLVSDLITAGDTIVLVVPIDLAAPKGRLILPQVQVLREILDNDPIGLIVKERELEAALSNLKQKPKLVICDSQVVLKVAGDVPLDVNFTTFSTLFARYKGDLSELVKGANMFDNLEDGDKVLIAEACSHHIQADDIGRVKIPRWIRQYTGLNLQFDIASGYDFPDNLEEYKLVVHCGGCMLNSTEMERRILECKRRNVPITNYGVSISKLHGLLDRVIEPFGVRG